MSLTLSIIKSTHGEIDLDCIEVGDRNILCHQHDLTEIRMSPTWTCWGCWKWLRTLSFNKVDLMNTYSTWTIRTSFVSYPDNSVILSGLIWRTSDWVPNKMTCEWIVSVHIKYFNLGIFCGSLKELLLETSCPLDLWKKSRWLMTFGY